MSNLQDIQIVEKAKRINHMSIDELLEFEEQARDFVVNGPTGTHAHQVAKDAFVESSQRLRQIREEQTPEKEKEAPFVHPRDKFKQQRDEVVQQLKNPNLSKEQKEDLEYKLKEADTVVKGWEKIDAEEQKTTDFRQKHIDAQAAIDSAA